MSLSRVFKGSIATAKSVGPLREHHNTALFAEKQRFWPKLLKKIKVNFFFSENYWFFGKKISLLGYFLWSIPLIIHSEHLPIQKYLVISTVALACWLIYFRVSNCHDFPCLQFCVHILTFLKASSLKTKWVTPNLHLKVELVSKELNHLAAILHVYVVSLIFMNKKNINFEKEKGNTFTHLIIFIVKSLQKEQNSTNLLLWPPICRSKSAITPKWFNSLD